MERRRDDHRLDYRSRDVRDSQSSRNATLERQAERQVVRIERRDLGRNDSAPSLNADNNDWKADREKFASTLVNDGVVRDYGKRDERGRNFPATNARDLRPHIDFKHRNEGGNNNFRRPDYNNNNPNNNDSTRPPVNRKPIQPLKPIDRKKRCPFLMRVFLSHNNHNDIASYDKGAVPKEELAIYTWPDAKLKEVAQLIRESYPDADKPDSTLKFSRVYPDTKTGAWQIAEVGKIGSRIGNHDFQNVHDLGFLIGDYMDVAIQNRK